LQVFNTKFYGSDVQSATHKITVLQEHPTYRQTNCSKNVLISFLTRRLWAFPCTMVNEKQLFLSL